MMVLILIKGISRHRQSIHDTNILQQSLQLCTVAPETTKRQRSSNNTLSCTSHGTDPR